jgi:hypothetical protein
MGVNSGAPKVKQFLIAVSNTAFDYPIYALWLYYSKEPGSLRDELHWKKKKKTLNYLAFQSFDFKRHLM